MIVICAIAKNENKYINDWVNWHLNLGFDHIYIFDNNDSKTEFIGNFIDRKDKVTIYNKNDISEDNLQSRCYNEFYRNYKDKFSWCLFIDIDEYLDTKLNLEDFLSDDKFNDFDQIRITWKTFSDNNLIERDEKVPVYKAFTQLSTNPLLHDQAKSFLRGGLPSIWAGVHRSVSLKTSPPTFLKQCTASGIECHGDECVDICHDSEPLYLNHYRTKSLKEFIEQKLNRGDACMKDKKIDFNYYWISNKKTIEKENYIKEYLKHIAEDGQCK